MLALKMFAVPVLVLAIAGLEPFMLNAIPCVIVSVGLPTVIVPVAAPILTAVAAPKAFTVVELTLNTAAVAAFVLTVPVPVVALPRISSMLSPAVVPKFNTAVAPPMLVVLAPPVAKFTVPVVTPV